MNSYQISKAVIAAAQSLADWGLNPGTSGNIGVRMEESGILLTPSGIPPHDMVPEDLVSMFWDGKWSCEAADNRPTSEWRIHRDILQAKADVGAVVHCHPPFSTALACLHREIPSFHYMVAVAGGDAIPCAAYATFGTEALSSNVLDALTTRDACLMANHGMLACGATLDKAVRLAQEIEVLAEQYWRALQIGEPILLPKEEMSRVLEKFQKGYGYGSGPEDSD